MVEISYIDTASFTAEQYRELLNRLSEERRQRAERYRTTSAAYLSAGAGYLLDCALSRAGLTGAAVSYGEHGKPYIDGFHFNLSHSGTVAVLAVGGGEVGVDIEKIAPVQEKLIKRVCTERECAYLYDLSEEERAGAFFRLWTAKESAAKFLGTGLASPKEFEVDLCKEVVRGGAALPIREYALDGYALTACAEEEFSPVLKEVLLNS
ncbi:MAG: 4'-phosphopantetheinyl transferase superfamily protein [Clostridia bacterium]|nr:4'-phosphopantetheinyl transferase superfamily protein [Clostridia bacterium]